LLSFDESQIKLLFEGERLLLFVDGPVGAGFILAG